MVYKEITIGLLDPNPFQTRKEYDPETLAGLATSSMDKIGIRNVPIVRPSPKKNGRYQIASGHGRVAAWKTLGHKTIMCRVESLTDSQMKKEILVENINRADLSEEERFQALEQYRLDLGLKKEHGLIPKLSKETGIPASTLEVAYDVQHVRNLLIPIDRDFAEEPSQQVIVRTRGLPDEERVKLVVKAMDMGWGGLTVLNVKTALREMEPEVRALILDEKTTLPYKVIVAVSKLENPEMQKDVIKFIQTHGYNEELALRFIERASEGELMTDVTVVNEPEAILRGIRNVYETVASWGVNERMILGPRWNEALQLFDRIEEKIRELRETQFYAQTK